MKLPPIFSITGANDQLLGLAEDCQRLLDEAGAESKVRVIGKKQGNLNDYDHIGLLTHKDAIKDHFPLVLDQVNNQKMRVAISVPNKRFFKLLISR